MRRKKEEQLCFTCKTCPRCEWMAFGIKVPGWDAEYVPPHNGEWASYAIKSCPKYEKDFDVSELDQPRPIKEGK